MNLTPGARWLRTLLQVLVAVCVAIPTAIALVPIPSKYSGAVALVVGIAAAAKLIVSAVQNAIEARSGVVLFGSNVQPAPTTSTPAVPAVSPPQSPEQPRGPP